MTDYFPTEFAIKLLRKVDLYPKKNLEDYDEFTSSKKKKEKRIEAIMFHDSLAEFQKLSISCDFENSLVAYHGIELTELQEDALKIIHESTPAWAKGNLVEKILSHINASGTSKDTKELSEILMKIIDKDMEGGSGNEVNALIINTTKRIDGEK